jgi:long-subunit fatty acid transport protein
MTLSSQAKGQTQQSQAGQVTSSRSSTQAQDGTLEWPQTIGVGVAVKPTDLLTFSADVVVTSWSKARYTHTSDSTSQTFDAQGRPQGPAQLSHRDNLVLLWPELFYPKVEDNVCNYPPQADSSQVRLGAEYVVEKAQRLAHVAVPVRVGFIRDSQLTKNTPDGSRSTYYGFTAGFGLAWKSASLDFAWVHMRGKFSYGYDVRPSDTYDYHGRYEDNTVISNRLFVSTVARF